MTTVNDQRSWFGSLSPRRRILYGLLLLFVASWCFFLGFTFAGEQAEARYEELGVRPLTGADLNEEDFAYDQVVLTGLKTVLIVGYDQREGYAVGRSDTMMVAFLNMDEKTVKLLSIPRDSYVQVPGYGKNKINHAFYYGGITATKETVEYLLGIKIDDYLMIDFEGFKQVVDAIGGVNLYVGVDMVNWNEGIEIYEGQHDLTGEEALGFVRYRGANVSDYDRIKNQQYFLRELMDKLLTFSSMTKIAELVNIGMENTTTTFTAMDALDLAKYAFQMDLAGMEVFTVPGYPMYLQYGEDWLSHEIINRSELTKILNQIAGDDFVFSPNVIDDGGLGRYSVPEGEEEVTDDPLLDPELGVEDPEIGVAEPDPQPDPDPQPNDGNNGNGNGNGNGGGEPVDVDDIPLPD